MGVGRKVRGVVRSRILRAIGLVYPIEQLERRFLLNSPDLSQLQSNLNTALTDANSVVQSIINATPLPVAGPLGSAINTLKNLQTQFNSSLGSINSSSPATAVQSALQSALGSGATVNIVQNTSSVDEFSVTQNVSSLVTNTPLLNFSSGLPALGLSGNVGLNFNLSSHYSLDFGINTSSGFFISTDASKTNFTFSPSITITNGSSLTGTFGPLAISASDYTGDPQGLGIGPTALTASFSASLTAPGGSNVLTTSTLAQVGANISLTGSAHLALNAALQASGGMASSFPSLSAVITLDWTIPSVNLSSAGISTQNLGNDPEFGLHNLTLDLGSTIDNILDPVLNDINNVLKPIKPVIDFINGPMPLFNDVGFLKSVVGTNSDGVCTVGNFFEFLANLDGEGAVAQGVVDFAQAVGDFYSLYSSVNGLSGSSHGLNLGSFTVGDAPGDSISLDLRNGTAVSNANFSGIPTGSGIVSDIESYLDGIGGSDFADALFNTSVASEPPASLTFGNNNQYSFDTNTADYGFHFPLLTDPGSILGILFGQNVNLFTYTTPPMDFGVPFLVNIPVFGPLVVALKGDLDNNDDAVLFGGQFSMGYDTYGLTHGNLLQNPAGALDGFYINETDTFLAAGFGIAADAAVDLVLVEAGVGGGINANVALGLNDPDSATDGAKLRFNQIETDLQNGPLGLFVFSGELTASLNAFVTIGFGPFSWTDSINFATITLLNFTTEAPAPVFAAESNGIVMLDLNAANADTSGSLAGQDDFTISDLGPDTTNGGEVIDINALGQDQILHGVKEITGEGGTQPFNLHIEPGVTAPVDIAGGYFPTDPNYKATDNNVEIEDQGSGPATLYASDGNDQLRVATPGSTPSQGAIIYGGSLYPGNPSSSQDVIETDGALMSGDENMIDGGTAPVTITGGPGNDYINVGNAATAVVDGGGGSNTVIGGTGADHFVVNFTDAAIDSIQANAGAISNLLQVNGDGGGETITASYQSGGLSVTSVDGSTNVSVTASNIQTLDIEPAPGLTASSLAATLPNGQTAPAPTLPTPAPGPINVDLESLNGSGLSVVYVNMLGSASGSSQVNPINVNLTGFGNDQVSVVGTYGSLSQSNTSSNTASQVYEITSSKTAGGLTVFTTDGPTDAVNYNAGTGSNTFSLQNQIVNPGQITFSSLHGTPGTDTYNITAIVGATNIDQNGKNIVVNIGPTASGGLSLIQAPIAIGGAVADSGQPSGYDGSVALNVTDATATVGSTGNIDTGLISGFDLGSNTITWTYLSSLDVTLGNHGNTANVDLTQPMSATIQAGNGGDNIQASPSTIPLTLLGGTGNDTIAASNNGDFISGGAGNDFLTEGVSAAHGGDDTIIGGNGSNHIVDDGAIGLIYGNDTTVDGSTGANLITGTATALIYTGPGQDTVTFTGGNDETVIAGGGNDLISLGDGFDSVYGAGGNDTITTGNGTDTIYAGDGNDSITTGDGGDRVATGNGNSTINSGAGDDIIIVGNGSNIINSGAGDDIIYIGTGLNSVNGGPGTNALIQSADVNQLLTNTTLSAVGITTFSNIQRVSLTGQTSNHTFDVSGWTNPGEVQITGGSGTNTIAATDDDNFTLNNTSLSRSDGTVFNLSNIQDAILTGGTSSNTFDVSGWTGAATLSGGGGLGSDTVIANDNTSMTLGLASLTRTGFGLVTLVNIVRALLTGDVGNLLLDASNFAGQATLVAGPGNDTLKAGTGGDYLAGGTGHDSLVSSSGADVINATAGAGDTINVGTGDDTVYSTNGADVIQGTPASLNPAIAATGPTFSVPSAVLPTGGNSSGPWAQDSGSASAGGVSNTTNTAIEPSVVAGSNAQYVAWSDDRNGTYQIYVAEQVGGVWQELAGSAHGGGISASIHDSRRPSIALDSSGNPMVAWTTYNGTSTDVYVADYQPSANGGMGGWVALGTSLSAGGISATGSADDAKIVESASGPVVTWLNANAGVTNVYAKRFSGGSWSALGAGGASGSGVTNSAVSVTSPALATDGTNVALAWTQPSGGSSYIYLLEFTGSAWVAVNGSASGSGIGGSVSSNFAQPTVAFSGGKIYAAWQQTIGSAQSILAATNTGGSWQMLSIDAPGSSVTSGNGGDYGAASDPQLAAGGSRLELIWTQAALASSPSFTTSIEANEWNGSSFVRQLPGDAELEGINQSYTTISSLSLAVDSNGNPFATWGDPSSGVPQVYFRGDSATIHNVYYVNDTYTSTDLFTTVSGASGNTGLSPSSPLNSVQAVLSKYSLVAGDTILVDSGSYAGFTVPAADAGITIIGAGGAGPHFTSTVTISSTSNVTLEGLFLDGGLSISGSSNIDLRNASAAGVTITGGSNVRIEQDLVGSTGITLTGATASPYIEGNNINASTGITISGSGATSVDIVNNIVHAATGILLSATTQIGTIANNNITATATGLNISSAFTGSITLNDIHGATTGVSYSASAPLNANQIFNNSTGIIDTVNSNTTGLGFVGTAIPNNIFQNTLGVQLSGQMQDQHIFTNTTGVTGSGTLGGATLTTANLIETNTTGVGTFSGAIQFNRISQNMTGIAATSNQQIDHNLIYRNTVYGLLVQGASNLEVVSNTFYATQGDNIHIQSASQDVDLLSNIFSAAAGYDIYVADDSHTGFFSDYNDLYSTGTGILVHYYQNFTDILDWQVDVNQFDLHSIGTTVVNPTWAAPQFADIAEDNYQINSLDAGIRSTSPTLDAGDPIADTGVPSDRTNLLTNPGFESGTVGWSVNNGATTATSNPLPFSGAQYFAAGGSASTFAQQTISLAAAGFTAGQLSSIQDDVVVFGGRIRWQTNVTGDSGSIEVIFLDASSNQIGIPYVATATNTTNRWELVGLRQAIPAGTAYIEYRFQTNRVSGANDSMFDGAFAYVLPSGVVPSQGAYGNTNPEDTAETANMSPRIALQFPDLYVNWNLGTPQTIRWETYNNLSDTPIKIDLYQDVDGVSQFLMTITSSAPDIGQYTWIPQNSGLSAGMYGLRIEVSLEGDPAVYDRSTETFAIPPSGNNYYVDDASTTGDVYSTAPGSNRNTGKLPSSPLPLLSTLLRTYGLGPTNTVYVDTGTYNDFNPIVINGSNDAGVTITGPTNPADVASLSRAYTGSAGPVIEINGAASVSVSHLTLIGSLQGIWVHNGAIRFNGSYITTSGNSMEGIRLESDATQSTLDHITVFGSGNGSGNVNGIYIGGQITSLTNSQSYNNSGDGIYLANAGSTLVTGNIVYGNQVGIYVTNTVSSTVTMIGSSNLSGGNVAHDNSVAGIKAFYSVAVTGNTVYNQDIGAAQGIYLYSGGYNISASLNVVYLNTSGIVEAYPYADGTISDNRVDGNTGVGITSLGDMVIGNTVYSNAVGIDAGYSSYGSVSNNLVYANTTAGIQVNGDVTSLSVVNNTVYQPLGDAVQVLAGATGVTIENNILEVNTGYDLNVAPSSQVGFKSDYNDLYTTGSGDVGLWQGVPRAALSDWQDADFTDQNSLSQNPLFVNPAGADGILGFVSGIDHGSDDDFHLQSLYGSFHGGSFSPVLTATPGVLSLNPGTLTDDANQSPAIDRGDAAYAYSNEPTPNGSFINLGFEGDTSQASLSPVHYVTVITPNGGNLWPEGQVFTIRWRSDSSGSYNINLLQVGSSTPVLSIASNLAISADEGTYAWTIPTTLTPASNYLISVTKVGSGLSATSSAPFTIGSAVHSYYVNDNSTLGDQYSSAPGNDANSGLDPAHPKASISAVLQAYSLGSGDTIYVDTGVYELSSNVVLTALDDGVTIVGATTGASESLAYSGTLEGDGPLAYYRLGDGSGSTAADSSGNNLAGTYSATGVTLGQTGVLPTDPTTSALFNGTTGDVALPSGFANFTGGFTFSAWIYPTSSANQQIFDLGNGASSDNLRMIYSGNNLYFYVYQGSSAREISAGSLVINTWQQLTVTLDGSGNAVIYWDGLQTGSGALWVPNNITRTKNFLAGGNQAGYATFSGQMQEAAFFNQALSQAQVRQLYDIATAKGTLLDRDNTAAGSYGIELQNANNVTLQHLNITGAYDGIHTTSGSAANASAGLTVSNSTLFANSDAGVNIDQYSSNASLGSVTAYGLPGGPTSADDQDYGFYLQGPGAGISSSVAHDDSYMGIYAGGAGSTVSGNTVYNITYGSYRYGIDIAGASSSASGNTVYASGTGIYAVYSGSGTLNITNNTVYDNLSDGIIAYYNVDVTGNTVYGQSGSGAVGIYFYSGGYGGLVSQNTVYLNTTGIQGAYPYGGGTISANRVYANSGVGIVSEGDIVSGNSVYSNAVGINAGYSTYAGVINNLVYANTTAGIQVSGSASGINVTNNTVYQPVGDAIQVLAGASGVNIENNILQVNAGYDLNVNPASQVGFHSDYNDLYTTASGRVGLWQGLSYSSLANWFYGVGFDGDSLSINPQFVNPAGVDGILGYSGGADHGQDDNFHLQAGSPAIDAGDPATYWLAEPDPTGGRVNLGYDGNTASAAASSSQTLQILSPNGLAKLLAGQTYNVSWRSSGLTTTDTVGLINAGGSTVNGGTSGTWLASAYRTDGTSASSFTQTVNTSGVTNPAPQAVYQQYAYESSGATLSYLLPVPDGTYTIRLDFADPQASGAGQRVFDVKLQGTTVQSGYDIYAAAGASYKATELTFTVTASGGSGIVLNLVGHATSYGPLLSGIELTQANPAGGVANPTVNLQLSADGGNTWSTIASNLTMDRFGDGAYAWTVPSNQSSGSYELRVVSNDYPSISGTSVSSFQLSGAGHSYYINDNSTLGDQYTTAVGNDANSGKSPSAPMTSLSALINAYHPGVGDTIYIDTGVYDLSSNVVLTALDDGVTIVGATTGASESLAYSGTLEGDGPLAYYRLGDGSGSTAADSSGNNLAGTYSATGVTLGQTGVLPTDPTTSALFNGTTGDVALPSGFANFTGGFTFSAWIYPTSSANQQIFDLGNGASSDNLRMIYSGNNLYFYVYQGSSAREISAGSLVINTWQQLTVTLDGSGNAVIYWDGLQTGSGALWVPNNITRTKNFLAGGNQAGYATFSGQMQEAAFFNQALSQAQVRQLYDIATAKGTLLDRDNTAAGSYGIELQNANNVTLQHLNITGAYDGIHTTSGSAANASAGLTVSNSTLFANSDAGVNIDQYSSNASLGSVTAYGLPGGPTSADDQDYGFYLQGPGAGISSSVAHDDSYMGIYAGGAGSTVSGNTVYNITYGSYRYGIDIAGASSSASGNTVYASGTGIYAVYSGSGTLNITNNTVYDNLSDGIIAYYNVDVTGNTVYGQSGSGAVGIYFYSGGYGGLVSQNTVYLNTTGIQGAYPYGGGTISANRVYANSGVGIVSEGDIVSGNSVYSNAVGINAGYSTYAGVINNLVYANTTAGIQVSGSASGINVTNNTVYQPVGDAIQVLAGASGVNIENNILQVNAGYDLNVNPASQVGFHSDYNDLYTTASGRVGLWQGLSYSSLANWFYGVGFDGDSLSINPQFVNPAGVDGILGYSGGADHGQDDNFHLQAGSPAIDAGDPATYWLAEPDPTGGRVNLGYDGNTASAAASSSQTLQILSPNGLAKLLAGQTYNVSWRSSGLTTTDTVGLINAGGSTVNGGTSGTWLASAYRTDGTSASSFTQTVNTSGVTNPAPQAVYQQYAYESSGATLSYLLPVPDGTYTIRLDFADPQASGAGQRVFDVKLQGTTVQSGYDIYAAAGASFKATELTFTVTASGGSGIVLNLVGHATSYGPLLSGIELTQANPAGGVANPTVNLQLSADGGNTWSTIASNLTMDRFGDGAYAWTVPSNQSSGSYELRVVSNDYPSISGTSVSSFQLSGAGHSYYINDNSTLGDQYTTAVGNDANSGKSPSAPMTSLSALINAYHPGVGDTIYIDTGVYDLSSNVVLTALDDGVTIVGATTGASESLAYSGTLEGDGPLAYYRLGDGSGSTAADSSGNNLAGTYSATGVTLGQTGVLPTDPTTSALFNGTTGDVALPGGFANFTGGFTFSAWIYPTSSANQQIFDLGNGASSDNLRMIYSGNNLYFYVYQGTSAREISAGSLVINTWQQLTVTLDGSGNAVIYWDGLQTGSGALWVPNNITRTKNFLAGGNQAGYATFSGQMQEAAFFNQALSQAQVRQLYDIATAKGTLLDRDNTAAGSYGIELQNANNVTLQHLNITGAYDGIHTTSGSAANASAGLTVSNSTLFANSDAGVNVDQYSSNASLGSVTAYGLPGGPTSADDQDYGFYLQGPGAGISSSVAHDDSYMGIYAGGAGSTVSGNTVYNITYGSYRYGIDIAGASSSASGNTVYASGTGIYAVYSGSGTLNITNNTVYDNLSDGIIAYYNVDVTGNTVYGQSGSGAVGIYFYSGGYGGLVSQNTVYLNTTGIQGAYPYGGGTISANRVYANSGVGIVSEGDIVSGNSVYSNAVGINAGYSTYAGVINNLVYANTTAGIQVSGSASGINVTNNTVYQPVGDAIQVLAGASGVNIENNILESGAGYDLNVASTGETGFKSDYNDLFEGTDPRAAVGLWGGTVESSLSNWQSATSDDAHSISADPMWQNISGADHVLGYTTTNGGYNGGDDDNFYLSLGSPAIGAGNPAVQPAKDITGTNRSSGSADLGAYVYQGTAVDTTPPAIVSTNPAGINNSGSVATSSLTGNAIVLSFNKALNPIDADAPAEYQLIGAGPDGVFGTGDDVVYNVSPTYVPGSMNVSLGLPSGGLPAGLYQLTVYGTAYTAIHDLSGLGMAGSYIRTFTLSAQTQLNLTGPAFYLKLDADGQHVDVWTNTTGTGSYSQQVLLSSLSGISVQGTTGSDTLVVDFSAGVPLPASGISDIGGGNGSGDVLRIVGSAGNDVISASNGLVVFNGLTITAYNVTGMIFTPGAGTDSITVNSGTLMLAPSSNAPGITDMNFSSINIGAGAKLAVTKPATPATRSVLITSSLTIAQSAGTWTGTLDLSGNDLVIHNGSLSTVTSEIASGYNAAGNWQGAGITSSEAASDSTHLTTLGLLLNNDGSGNLLYGSGTGLGLFDGVNVVLNDVLVKYTYYGDANLDGKVDASDYSKIDSGYLVHASGWSNGDFNYDGTINGSDYTLIDNAFNMQGARLSATLAIPSAAVSVSLPLNSATSSSGGAQALTQILARSSTSQRTRGASFAYPGAAAFDNMVVNAGPFIPASASPPPGPWHLVLGSLIVGQDAGAVVPLPDVPSNQYLIVLDRLFIAGNTNAWQADVDDEATAYDGPAAEDDYELMNSVFDTQGSSPASVICSSAVTAAVQIVAPSPGNGSMEIADVTPKQHTASTSIAKPVQMAPAALLSQTAITFAELDDQAIATSLLDNRDLQCFA